MNLKELQRLDKKYNILNERVCREEKEPSIFFNEELYDWQDWAEIELAKETTKINPEGEKIRLKIIERNKCLDT